MTYDELLNILAVSSHKDWLMCNGGEYYLYKGDLGLSIRSAFDFVIEDQDSIPWRGKLLQSQVTQFDYDISYNNCVVLMRSLWSIDGTRGLIPVPRIPGYTLVSIEDVAFAGLLSDPAEVQAYMKDLGLDLEGPA